MRHHAGPRGCRRRACHARCFSLEQQRGSCIGQHRGPGSSATNELHSHSMPLHAVFAAIKHSRSASCGTLQCGRHRWRNQTAQRTMHSLIVACVCLKSMLCPPVVCARLSAAGLHFTCFLPLHASSGRTQTALVTPDNDARCSAGQAWLGSVLQTQ